MIAFDPAISASNSVRFEAAQRDWTVERTLALTDTIEVLSPSEWAEAKRYLPKGTTTLPGYYRFEVTPYLREPLDCFAADSPIREVSFMKGVQLGLTTLLENVIGYYIDHVKTAPMMLVTADAELAKTRLDTYIIPMLQHSDLMHLIRSADENNPRKTGKTDKKIEWDGGGFLIPYGAKNANKLRSLPIQILLDDEVDGWPTLVGKDGDPVKLSRDRTAAFEDSRKILDVSTPLIKGQSKIEQLFQKGDQRRYFVCCLNCGHAQTLRWRRDNPETGERTGIVWDMDDGRLVPGSVRYLCERCSHPHTNDDKTRLFSPDNGAEWRPTAKPVSPAHRSYHLSALYSPVGMQTWEACVLKWLDAWDVENNRPRDNGKLQVFYNNVLGEPFEVRGEKLRFETVSSHRRHAYGYGRVPNGFATKYCGGPAALLTCAVDVHADNLAVAVFAWCRDRRAVLVDYWRFVGDTEQLDDPGTWGALRTLIETKEYTADDGKKYRIALTLVDSGYRTDHVHTFCGEYQSGVFPIKGREAPPKNSPIKEFTEYETPGGLFGYHLNVNLYKDRWAGALRRPWDGLSMQPAGHFNAPLDATDKQLKELTVETKVEVLDKETGQRVGFEWRRPGGAANELWDLLMYNSAALDLLAWDVCRNQLAADFVSYPDFFDLCEARHLYFVK